MTTPQTRFSVSVARDEDFPELVDAMWAAFENPLQALLRLYFPLVDNDREKSLAFWTPILLEEAHKEAGEMSWIKVVDTQAGENKIVAVAQWYFYDEDPYAKAEANGEGPLVAEWYPEGVTRDFVTTALRQFLKPRENMARRPHAFLHICGVLPEYRRQGIGRLIMDWGHERADALNLESWLDASQFGAPLYTQYGYQEVLKHSLDPLPKEGLSEKEREEWAECQETLLPVNVTVMWRPPRGEYVDGVTIRPWEMEVRS